MSVFDAAYQAIDAIQTVSGRVFHAEALKNASAPFIFWIQTGERFEQTLEGYTELGEDRYEIHIVTKNLSDLNSISRAVWNALIDLQGEEKNGVLYENVQITQVSPVIDEREVNLYRKVYSVTINYQEE